MHHFKRLLLCATAIALVSASGASIAMARSMFAGRDRAARASLADSVRITVVNRMPHAIDFSYEKEAQRVPIGHVDEHGTEVLTIRGLEKDSVTVWSSSEMGDASRTFPTHSTEPLSWIF